MGQEKVSGHVAVRGLIMPMAESSPIESAQDY